MLSPDVVLAHYFPSLMSLSTLLSSPREPDYPFAFTASQVIPWRQFGADVQTLTAQLRATSKLRYAICHHDSYWFSVCFWAAIYANKHVILPGNHQPNALCALREQFDVLLCDNKVQKALLCGEHDLVLMPSPSEHTHVEPSTFAFAFDELCLAKVAITLFTSGSSGLPKAIFKTLHQLNCEIEQLEQMWGASLQQCVVHSTVSHQHIYGLLFRVLWPMSAGRPFACDDLHYPEQVLTTAHSNSVLISSPALLKRLETLTIQPQQGAVLSSRRAIFSSGGPLAWEAAQHCAALQGCLPIEVFGSTETGGVASRQQSGEAQAWELFPRIQAKLNGEGCLTLLSPHIDGDQWYQTADHVVFHNARQFELQGRKDRVVKIEEKRISLTEVELRASELEWIADVAVLPLQESKRLILVAAIVLSASGEKKLASVGKGPFWLALRAALKQWLEPVAIPRRFRFVYEIPQNSQSKRLVSEIEQLFN